MPAEHPDPAGSPVGWPTPARPEPELLPRKEIPSTYVVRLELDASEPPIWRRLRLASDLSLDVLHRVIQAAMGWSDVHEHEFAMVSGDDATAPFLTEPAPAEGDEGTAERDVRLDEVMAVAGDRLQYCYDLGDVWDHTLLLEAVEDGAPDRPAAVVDGVGRCPVEDSGGVGAWNEVVAWCADPDTEALADDALLELVEWLPVGLDPELFDEVAADHAVRDASVTTDQLALRIPPHPALVGLVAQLPEAGVRLLASLAPDASEVPEVTPQEALRPLLALLRLTAVDGVELTPTGQMRQAAVKALLEELGWVDWVFGKTLHEQHLPPVRMLRAAAESLALLQRRSGRLVLTPRGQQLAADPGGLWSHVIERLPAGDTPEEQATGALWLLTLRPHERTYEAFDLHVPALLAMAGWQVGGRPPDRDDTWDWMLPTLHLLHVVDRDHSALAFSDAALAVAHAALWKDAPAR